MKSILTASFLISMFVLSGCLNTVEAETQLLISDYPRAFTSNTVVVVGDGSPHGPREFHSETIDGLCGGWIAVKLAEHYEAPDIIFDTDVTSWHDETVDLLDNSHNLIVVGCHWVNIVAYHYFYMKRNLVSAYPGNYEGDDPLVWPEFLVEKDSGERFAYWSDVEFGRNDFGVMITLRDGDRNVLILWSYTEYATIAMTKILENINSASDYGWRLNSEAVFVTWNDHQDDDEVQLEEVTTQPLIERPQTIDEGLWKVSTEILCAPANALYFIRTGNMFDDSSLGFVSSTCNNRPQKIIIQTDSNYINQATGIPLFSENMILFGGPIASETVKHYEDVGLARITYQGDTTHHRFMKDSTPIYSVDKSTYNYNTEDYFVAQIYIDGERVIFSLWGIAQTGTYAGGVYFSDVIQPNLQTYTQSYIIGKWSDTNGDGIQQSDEIIEVASGN